jgi:hypothetical protein
MTTRAKFGLNVKLAIMAALGLSISACDEDHFEQPADVAIKRLAAKTRTVEGTGMGSLKVSGGDVRKEEVAVWVGKAGGSRRIRCAVTVTATSDTASKAVTDCSQPQAANQPIVSIGAKAMTIVVREHVAATIEPRPYDIDKVAEQMIALASMSAPVLVATMKPPGDDASRR